LPASSPLWAMGERVILTPHVAGYSPRIAERHLAVLLDNVRRFVAGGGLANGAGTGRGGWWGFLTLPPTPKPDRPPTLLCVAAAAAVFWAMVFWFRYRRDRGRILDEAERQRCEASSIRWLLLPFGRGPFSFWEWSVPGCRTYRVKCREAAGRERIASVLIGP